MKLCVVAISRLFCASYDVAVAITTSFKLCNSLGIVYGVLYSLVNLYRTGIGTKNWGYQIRCSESLIRMGHIHIPKFK